MIEMDQSHVVPVVVPLLQPLLLDKLEDVVTLQLHLFKLYVATARGHSLLADKCKIIWKARMSTICFSCNSGRVSAEEGSISLELQCSGIVEHGLDLVNEY